MKTLPDLGFELQEIRKKAGVTQEQLGKSTGMRQEAISRFERGRGNDFSLAKALRLAQTMGYELQFVPMTDARPTLDDVLAEVQRSANTGPNSR